MLKEKIEELKFNLEEVKEQNRVTSEEKVNLKAQVKQLLEEMEILNSENTSFQEDLESRTEIVKTTKKESLVLEEKVNILLAEKSTLEEKLEKLTGGAELDEEEKSYKYQFEEAMDEKSQWLCTKQELEREIEILKSEQEKLKKELLCATDQISSFQPEREMLESKLSEMSSVNRQINKYKEENVELLKKLEALQGQMEEEKKGLSEKFDSEIQEKLSGLEAVIKSKDEALETVGGTIRELEEKNRIAEHNIVSIKEERDMHTSKIEELSVKLKENLENFSDGKKVTEELEEKISQLTNRNRELEELLQTSTSELEEKCKISEEKCLSCESELLSLKSELDVKLSDMTALQERHSCLSSEHNETVDKLNSAEENVKTQKGLLESMSEEISSLQTNLNETRNSNEVLSKEINNLKNTLVQSEMEASSLKSTLDSLKEGSDQFSQEVTNLKENLARVNVEKESLSVELTKLTKIKEEIEISLSETKESLKREVQSSADIKAKCDSLQAEVNAMTEEVNTLKETLSERDEQLSLNISKDKEAIETKENELKAYYNEKFGLLKNKLVELKQQNELLQKENEEMGTDLEDKNNMVASFHELKEELVKTQGRLEEVSGEKKLLQDQIQLINMDFTKKFEASDGLLSQTKEQLAMFAAKCEDLNQKVIEMDSLKEELEQTKVLLSEAQQEKQKCKQDLLDEINCTKVSSIYLHDLIPFERL